MKRCAIVTGGNYQIINHIERCDFVISCDKGYEYCKKQDIHPDLLIGDFDSYKGMLPDNVEKIILPEEKDDTDTMHAYRYCLKHDFNEIYLYCAFGGRMDHFISNIQTAVFGAKNNITTYMGDDNNTFIITNNNEWDLPKKEGYSLSVFAADNLTGVSISGAKYNLDNYDINNSFPVGQSNEWAEDTVHITKKEGVMIMVFSKLTN